jgi:hypothetical protein
MTREILKQMMPFFILLGVLWVAAELLENTFSERRIIAPPVNATPDSP